MDFLKSKDDREPILRKIPRGSFTINKDGQVVSSTLPSNVPPIFLFEISARVVKSFQAARQQGFVAKEMIIRFATMKLIAKEVRGGFLVYLTPMSGKRL